MPQTVALRLSTPLLAVTKRYMLFEWPCPEEEAKMVGVVCMFFKLESFFLRFQKHREYVSHICTRQMRQMRPLRGQGRGQGQGQGQVRLLSLAATLMTKRLTAKVPSCEPRRTEQVCIRIWPEPSGDGVGIKF